MNKFQTSWQDLVWLQLECESKNKGTAGDDNPVGM
jgi:hypothetical protein